MNLTQAAHGIQLTNRPAQRGSVQFGLAQPPHQFPYKTHPTVFLTGIQGFGETSHEQDGDNTWICKPPSRHAGEHERCHAL